MFLQTPPVQPARHDEMQQRLICKLLRDPGLGGKSVTEGLACYPDIIRTISPRVTLREVPHPDGWSLRNQPKPREENGAEQGRQGSSFLVSVVIFFFPTAPCGSLT